MEIMHRYPTVGELLAEPSPIEDTFTARGLLYGMHQNLEAFRHKKEEAVSRLTASNGPLDAELRPLSLDEQADHLLRIADRTKTDVFVSAGLRIGGQRMDDKARAEGTPVLHERIISRLIVHPQGEKRYQAGQQEVVLGNERGMPFFIRRHVQQVAEHIDWRLNNPALVYNALGSTRQRGLPNSRPVFVTASMDGVMRTEGWSPELRALAVAVGMHYTAMRNARQGVTPVLSYRANLPTIHAGAEQRYWQSRLFGAGEYEGICYYLGYVDKSRARLRAYMQNLWGENFEENRQVFLATLLLRVQALTGPRSKEEAKAIRRPLYRAIAEGDFARGKDQLVALAAEQPHLFSSIGLDYFAPGAARPD